MAGGNEVEAIQKVRGPFICMAGSYSLGVFNDNFYKQAALLLAVSAGHPELQGYALAIYTSPYVLLGAPAGWAADRFSKRTVIIGAKWCELAAVLFGAAGICLENWTLIFSMLAIMGIQAAFFSPSLNGSIPELYPSAYITRANAILRMAVTFALLSGIALGGVALDISGTGFGGIPNGRLTVAGVVVGAALLGLVISIGVPRRPAADPAARFPWSGPLASLRKLRGTRRDPLLALTIGADVFIWFVGSLQILLINPLGIRQFHMSKALTSALVVAQMLGVGVGGFLGSALAKGERWHRVLGPAAVLFSLLMIALAGAPLLPFALQQAFLFIMAAAVGISGGVFLIPVESFIQARPAAREKGDIVAVDNFIVFAGIMVSSLVSNLLNTLFLPTFSFGVVGAFSLAAGLWFHLMYRRTGGP